MPLVLTDEETEAVAHSRHRPLLAIGRGNSVSPAAVPFIVVSDRRALLRSGRLRRVELPVTLLDAASPPVAGNRGADVVRASPFARSGNFLLRLAGC